MCKELCSAQQVAALASSIAKRNALSVGLVVDDDAAAAALCIFITMSVVVVVVVVVIVLLWTLQRPDDVCCTPCHSHNAQDESLTIVLLAMIHFACGDCRKESTLHLWGRCSAPNTEHACAVSGSI